MHSYLYVIVFPEKGIFKIGKADDVRKRLTQLIPFWGQPDYNISYHLKIDKSKVFHLEKSLHHIMSEYSVQFDVGDGKTELFMLDALDVLLKYIDVYLINKPDSKLIQGVEAIPNQVPDNLTNKESLGYIVKYLRKQKNRTQEEFAKDIGIFPRVLTDIERGTGNPTLSSLNKIADAVGCKVMFVRRDDVYDCLLP